MVMIELLRGYGSVKIEHNGSEMEISVTVFGKEIDISEYDAWTVYVRPSAKLSKYEFHCSIRGDVMGEAEFEGLIVVSKENNKCIICVY
ncbi:MAG: hypothetical protein DRO23_05625 [Thermoprotei archaeon]|nr:MAG: hypothetical protein DRO23_05625 [Thermoprotei archaeon]